MANILIKELLDSMEALMNSGNTAMYGKFTRKQANVLFCAHKEGNIFMTRKQINEMYALINYACVELDADKSKLYFRLKDAIDYIYLDEYELAQDCINGKPHEDGFERYACAADVDRFDSWNIEPEYISIEPTFNGYRIIC